MRGSSERRLRPSTKLPWSNMVVVHQVIPQFLCERRTPASFLLAPGPLTVLMARRRDVAKEKGKKVFSPHQVVDNFAIDSKVPSHTFRCCVIATIKYQEEVGGSRQYQEPSTLAEMMIEGTM